MIACLPGCLARNKSRVCSSEWHVLAPPPPAAALRCWVEAQQPGERSSNFAAATLVSPIASHFFLFFFKWTKSAASRPSSRSAVLLPERGRVRSRSGSVGLFYVCVFPSAPDDRVFGSRRWARLKWLAGEDKGVESRPAVLPLPVGSTWSSCKFWVIFASWNLRVKIMNKSHFVSRSISCSPCSSRGVRTAAALASPPPRTSTC